MRRLKEFNIALLEKWCWWIEVGFGIGFWWRDMVRRLEVGGRSVSSWWREIAKIRDGVGEINGGWFPERVSKVIGDGTNTFFRLDMWAGDVPLCRSFTHLFDLTTNKYSTMADMCAIGGEDGGHVWSWRRRLWVWDEEMVEKCRILLANVVV